MRVVRVEEVENRHAARYFDDIVHAAQECLDFECTGLTISFGLSASGWKRRICAYHDAWTTFSIVMVSILFDYTDWYAIFEQRKRSDQGGGPGADLSTVIRITRSRRGCCDIEKLTMRI